MKLVLAPFGSRGDVDPALALGARLAERGHEVVLCAPVNFRDAAAKVNIPFHAVDSDFEAIMRSARGNTGLLVQSLRTAEAQFDALMEVSRDADMILGIALQFAARTVAEHLRIKYRYAVLSPMYLRAISLPSFLFQGARLPAFAHRLHWQIEDASILPKAKWLAHKRRDLGLSAIRSLHHYLLGDSPLGAFDPVLTPRPDDAISARVTGYWRRKSGGEIPGRVRDFLGAGPAPLYVGFGSMSGRDSAARLVAFARDAANAGHRLIVGKGWNQVAESLDSNAQLIVDDAPHELLFRHISLAIHHGGAGTTVAAALAGVPQIIIPHLGDQFYHGARVATLGLGPAPVPLAKLKSKILISAINKVTRDGLFAERARAFAAALRTREGSSAAIRILEG